MSAPGRAGTVTAAGRASTRLDHVPALDGLRAIAVIAVLLYHADLGSFRGGFLGVDVFFVLSGYLITCVLLAGRRGAGGLRLREFWLRRARRLLPALLLMLAVTCAYTAVFLPHEAAKLRGDALAALGYVTNWQLVFGDQSYFAAVGRPSMVQHLWSLAVEEQFYLVWPLLLGAGLLVFRRRPRRLVLLVLAGAAASALLMALLYHPTADPSRVYYGTDTHATGLLLGAALAVVWPAWRLSDRTGRGAPIILDLAGLLGLGALVWCFDNVSEFDPGLYRGGYAAFALVAALVVAAAVHPAARLCGALLGNAPLRWIGMRSYGIYLWHWPVYLVTRPRLDVPLTGVPLLALRVAITVTLAALSYRFVEAPIRAGAIGRSLAALRHGRLQQRRVLVRRLGLAGTGAVVAAALLGLGLAAADPAPRPPGFATKSIRIPVTTTTPTTTTEAPPVTAGAPSPAPAPAPPPPPAPAPPPPARVTAIGDSVMLGAHGALQVVIGEGLALDAAVSRQFDQALAVVRLLHDAGQLGERVVMHMGNNGIIRPDQFDQMMQMLAGVPRVVVVNANVARPWEGPVNDVLASGVPRYPNAVLVDWKAVAVQHPELFVEDGIHLQTGGALVYADLIAHSL
jgi:peptidoglycan/LPS O-acetylase OafA/YrhL